MGRSVGFGSTSGRRPCLQRSRDRYEPTARDPQEQEIARKAIERSNTLPGVPQVTASGSKKIGT
jgi:hypothetical protein